MADFTKKLGFTTSPRASDVKYNSALNIQDKTLHKLCKSISVIAPKLMNITSASTVSIIYIYIVSSQACTDIKRVQPHTQYKPSRENTHTQTCTHAQTRAYKKSIMAFSLPDFFFFPLVKDNTILFSFFLHTSLHLSALPFCVHEIHFLMEIFVL